MTALLTKRDIETYCQIGIIATISVATVSDELSEVMSILWNYTPLSCEATDVRQSCPHSGYRHMLRLSACMGLICITLSQPVVGISFADITGR